MKRLAWCVVLLTAVLAVPVSAQVSDPLGPFGQLATYGAGLLAAGALGLTKRYTGIADTAAFKLVKPVQPVIVGAVSLLLYPFLTKTFHLHEGSLPPADVFAQAPTAALVGTAAAEIWAKLFPKK